MKSSQPLHYSRTSCSRARALFGSVACAFAILAGCATTARADALTDVRERGVWVWGADAEGGGPYVFPDPADPTHMTGFEAELATLLARELGVRDRFFQGPWQNLPALLGTGQIDAVMNGYELTSVRAANMEHSRPYYVYELVLLARRDGGRVSAWRDLETLPADGRKLKIGVLQA